MNVGTYINIYNFNAILVHYAPPRVTENVFQLLRLNLKTNLCLKLFCTLYNNFYVDQTYKTVLILLSLCLTPHCVTSLVTQHRLFMLCDYIIESNWHEHSHKGLSLQGRASYYPYGHLI